MQDNADTVARIEPCALCGTPTQGNYSIQAEPRGGLGFETCWVFLCPKHAPQHNDGGEA